MSESTQWATIGPNLHPNDTVAVIEFDRRVTGAEFPVSGDAIARYKAAKR